MYSFKRYFIILLLTVFVFGSMAATAMAYCGSGHDTSSMVSGSDSAMHHQSAMQAGMMDHDSEGMDHAVKHHNSTDENSNSPDCFDCYGSLCHSQSLLSFNFALGSYRTAVALHVEQDINHKYVYLATIPQPPKQLS